MVVRLLAHELGQRVRDNKRFFATTLKKKKNWVNNGSVRLCRIIRQYFLVRIENLKFKSG